MNEVLGFIGGILSISLIVYFILTEIKSKLK
jgi:hypothetical protein